MQKLLIKDALDRLNKGELLIYPTETFFALGCKISQDAAIGRIFQIKRRLFAMPLPLILGDPSQLGMVAQIPQAIEDDVNALQAQFWPGPFSLILPARMHLSPLLTGGTGNIAVRVSPHPVASELARKAGEPLVSSSANISGHPAVTTSDALSPELTSVLGAVLDLPPAPSGGLPSTLVAPEGNGRLRLLRQGAITNAQLQAAGFSTYTQEQS